MPYCILSILPIGRKFGSLVVEDGRSPEADGGTLLLHCCQNIRGTVVCDALDSIAVAQVGELQLVAPQHDLAVERTTREEDLVRHFSLLALQTPDAGDCCSVVLEGVGLIDSAPHVVELYCAVLASAQKTVVS